MKNNVLEEQIAKSPLKDIRNDIDNWKETIWNYMLGYRNMCNTDPTNRILQNMINDTFQLLPNTIKFKLEEGSEDVRQELFGYLEEIIHEESIEELKKDGRMSKNE